MKTRYYFFLSVMALGVYSYKDTFLKSQRTPMIFNDRKDAGEQLLAALENVISNKNNSILVALPRGGVPVAYEIAQGLSIPLTTFIVRKIGSPHNPEFAIGALAQTGYCILNNNLISSLNISRQEINVIKEKEQEEALRRQKVYQKKGFPSLEGKDVIVVDDGIATGATMLVALKALKKLRPNRLIVAVPVASPESVAKLKQEADQVIALCTPVDFGAVGSLYASFPQVEDEEVISLLEEATHFSQNR